MHYNGTSLLTLHFYTLSKGFYRKKEMRFHEDKGCLVKYTTHSRKVVMDENFPISTLIEITQKHFQANGGSLDNLTSSLEENLFVKDGDWTSLLAASGLKDLLPHLPLGQGLHPGRKPDGVITVEDHFGLKASQSTLGATDAGTVVSSSNAVVVATRPDAMRVTRTAPSMQDLRVATQAYEAGAAAGLRAAMQQQGSQSKSTKSTFTVAPRVLELRRPLKAMMESTISELISKSYARL